MDDHDVSIYLIELKSTLKSLYIIYLPNIFVWQDKYRSDFYYIAPNYHKAFTSLDKAVFIDATDLEFTIDVKGTSS